MDPTNTGSEIESSAEAGTSTNSEEKNENENENKTDIGDGRKRKMRECVISCGGTLEFLRSEYAELEGCLWASGFLLEEGKGEIEFERLQEENVAGGVLDGLEALKESCKLEGERGQVNGQSQVWKACARGTVDGMLSRAGEVSDEIDRRVEEDRPFFRSLAGLASQEVQEPERQVEGVWMEAFYQKLNEVREYHARNDFSGMKVDDVAAGIMDAAEGGIAKKRQRRGHVEADGFDLSSLVAAECIKILEGGVFSGEEVLGKYLDLNQVHQYFMQHYAKVLEESNNTDQQPNKSSTTWSYVEFLTRLTRNGVEKLLSPSLKCRHRKKYSNFLHLLQGYLISFLKRTSPLLHVQNHVIQPALTTFQQQYETDPASIQGWQFTKHNINQTPSSSHTPAIDLSSYTSPQHLLQHVHPDALKQELARLKLKCGGTPQDRAKRLFTTKDTPLDKLPLKLFPNKINPYTNHNDTSPQTQHQTPQYQSNHQLAQLETQVRALLDQLRPFLEATLSRSQRRFTQTLNEKQKELQQELYGNISLLQPGEDQEEDATSQTSDSDDSEDRPIYNPKGVPLGWDGKPIPYWLFKLHGLNHYFPCEICGNESYRGRHNFEKHFTESKHAYGMRCLGIPNTKHFHGVTNIEDAQRLWEGLRGKVERETFDGGKDEEYEDSHGNVLTRATYEDLARQGLL